MPTQENYLINDQFGIARPDIMYKAWDYLNLDILNKLYGESYNPENCLEKIMKMNGVQIVKRVATFYDLCRARHDKEIDYWKERGG